MGSKRIKPIRWLFGLWAVYGLISCGVYTFSGASVPAEVRTIHIAQMRNNAALVLPSLSQRLSDAFRDKCLAETNLRLGALGQSDWEFTGEIVDYGVSAAAVSGRETTSLNRLTIVWRLRFRSLSNPKAGWEQRLVRYADFDAGTPFQSIENELVEQIVRQLVDDAFNKAFINW
ncbi:MAG: hypothetical protein EBR22_04995 [Cytophagia bacterium]|nr:hypothetical protein [Cytophagia bacterium]